MQRILGWSLGFLVMTLFLVVVYQNSLATKIMAEVGDYKITRAMVIQHLKKLKTDQPEDSWSEVKALNSLIDSYLVKFLFSRPGEDVSASEARANIYPWKSEYHEQRREQLEAFRQSPPNKEILRLTNLNVFPVMVDKDGKIFRVAGEPYEDLKGTKGFDRMKKLRRRSQLKYVLAPSTTRYLERFHHKLKAGSYTPVIEHPAFFETLFLYKKSRNGMSYYTAYQLPKKSFGEFLVEQRAKYVKKVSAND